jgi:Tol biopolymer transport system component
MVKPDKKHRYGTILTGAIVIALSVALSAMAASWNGYSMKRYTAETPHFRIYYHKGIEHLVNPVAAKFESLYEVYRNTYHFKLPNKTEVVLQDGDESNGLTFTNLNFIILWTHDFDFDLRGSHDWFDDVITHEFGHLASIWNALKYPAWIEGLQFGYFSHPNEPVRADLFHELPPEILPPWFTEGIAQYESSKRGSDSWDSHRDMILRTLTLSNRLLTWDHMQAFAGKGDDFEKTYNHGFSLVSYIAEKYGYDKVVAMAQKSAKLYKWNFDGVINNVLGIPADALYRAWKKELLARYEQQRRQIGDTVCGRKLNKSGYANYRPRFSPDGNKVYFLSNGKQDYGFKILFSYALADTVKEDDRIRPEMNVTGFYDIHAASGRIAFTSAKSGKSELPADRGGVRTLDLFIDTLPPEKEPFRLFPKKTERQVTFKQGIFSAAFSPTGDRLVLAKRSFDRFFLCLADTAGKKITTIYPAADSPGQNIHFIYSVAWSPDGHTIAFSYFDKHSRKIGLYDTATRAVTQLSNNGCDDRDPAFGPDGGQLYFSSDRTGIFNVYRYTFATRRLSRITNVLGGAFAPSLSPDGKKLAYAGYDSPGYGIYLLDTIRSVADTSVDTMLLARPPLPASPTADLATPSYTPYRKIPHQLLCRPTILAEQLNTKDNNIYSGASAFKAGVMLNLFDPYSWLGMGTELSGMFLMEPLKINKFINIDQGLIDIRSSFDASLSGTTQLLPLTLSFDYSLRGIAGQDRYYNETEGRVMPVSYNIRLQNLNVLVSHYFAGQGGSLGMNDDQSALHLLVGLDRYDVYMPFDDENLHVFGYNVGKEFRAGAMATYRTQAIDSRSSISPRGLAAKAQYNLWRLFSLNENNSFRIENGTLKENQNVFLYHEASARIMAGMEAPFFGDLYCSLKGDAIKVFKQDSVFPSFYQPIAWVPGYTYYFRGTTIKNVYDTIPNDTVLVTGNTVVSAGISYRFPLSPPLIDKKFWVFYLEKIYGCINLNGGIGVDHPSRILKFNREDWLLSWGTEVRLQASTFGGIPLAFSMRWDRGWDRPAPLGGDRFTLNIGFDFDNWYLMGLPDYHTPMGQR